MQSSALKRHGGKAYLAPKLIELMPYHNRYAECYFGTGAVMFAKSYNGIAEYANDLDGQLSNFWKVVADSHAFPLFGRLANLTPFSKSGFFEAQARLEACNKDTTWRWDEDVQRAIDFFVVNRQSRQALGEDFATPTTRIRRGMNENVSAWLSAVESLPWFHNRLKRVEIRCEDARDFIASLDRSESDFFYLDPPYPKETRSIGTEYGIYEMSTAAHTLLLDFLLREERCGKFMVSSYPNELYNEKLRTWRRVDFEIPNHSSSAGTKEIKTESVYMNY